MINRQFQLVSLILIAGICSLFQSCGDDPVSAKQDFMSGTITYIDNQFNFSGGYYAVSIYSDSTNPFKHYPLRTDSVAENASSLSAYNKVSGLPSGSYYIGSTWFRKSDGNETVLGSYGCNENPSCPTPIKVQVPSYFGTGLLDFRSRTH